ncbi:MAG: NADH-quinone oxidoreductase subunit H [Candidatus Eisenbacteria bacterium]|uniref:NADH-quinone oxidoreductase subunit H n=1 Tax=Eiseniibacteriota bacterium TaxID=2212470 RepID=A0A948W7S0_UNCEI|nr:NADH-quinone oxidoreductase subunit H [Candidatus Eisenbacteria bacterium]MBU1950295.1 NADH-quinone oxidoreductase subunit H [Candidatus Eisenbacteria bacterium]MBU2692889.1 NADH-quinone oxidoreductase subunit H [Candidatus Eisenbacteria bacterium]
MPDGLVTLIKACCVLAFQMILVVVLIWFERKGAAYIQDRTGPNRAEIFGIRLAGLVHPVADVLKLVFKEEITPPHVRKFYFRLAPIVSLMVALLPLAVIPFADILPGDGGGFSFQTLNLNVGILYILAVSSFGVFGIIFAGWGSNNKYSMLGGMRASAQMISYELAMGLSIVGVLMVYGTLELNEMVRYQGGLLWGFLPRWGIFVQPIAAILFMTAAFAESNRNPFDLPEGESEIVGFHVEYSSMKFACFFVGEYGHIVVVSSIFTALFLGGWQIPWLPTPVLRENAGFATAALLLFGVVGGVVFAGLFGKWRGRLHELYTDRRKNEGQVWMICAAAIAVICAVILLAGFWRGLSPQGSLITAAVVQIICFMAKVVLVSFFFIWVRWTLPRFRYDQLMSLGWKNLVPLAIFNILITGFILLGVG